MNPQKCVGYFTVSIAIYDGDTFPTVVDRIRRTSGVPGECVLVAGSDKHQCSFVIGELQFA